MGSRKPKPEKPKEPKKKPGPPATNLNVVPAPVFLVAAANAFVGMDLSIGAKRAFYDPPSVAERFLRETGIVEEFPLVVPADPLPDWNTAFVHHVGYWSLYADELGRSSWPLPAVKTAQELSEVAGHWNMLDDDPVHGDLFLLWNGARKCYDRTGIVVRLRATFTEERRTIHRCVVIEGDTSHQRARGRGMVLRLERRFGPRDRFVRWSRERETEHQDGTESPPGAAGAAQGNAESQPRAANAAAEAA